MLQVQYAASNSEGLLSSLIGWIDFGTILSLTKDTPTATVTNAIASGFTISFNISLHLDGDSCSVCQFKYRGFTSPVAVNVPFGNTAYTGIPGNVVLYMDNNTPTPIEATLTLSRITVRNAFGEIVPDFFFVVADAETTTKCADTSAETWSITTNGTTWDLVQRMPSTSGVCTGPRVNGIDTRTVSEIGNDCPMSNTSANVFLTQSPCQIEARISTPNARQGFAFGVIVPCNCQAIPLAAIRSSQINFVRQPITQVFCLPLKCKDTLVSIRFNDQTFSANKFPIIIRGQLGTYVFYDKFVLFNNSSTIIASLLISLS